jgi:predicted amidohydrolase YtcJ
MKKLDLLLKSTHIFTAETTSFFAGAVGISGERIARVFHKGEPVDDFISPDTKVIDCGDHLIMPGLIDSHVHFRMSAITRTDAGVHLDDCRSEQECVDLVAEFRRKNPDVDHIYGFGWLNTLWGENGAPLPTRHSLDAAVPDIPVYLESLDGHNSWVNTKALEKCGYTPESTSHFGGYVKEEDGSLSGVLIDLEVNSKPFSYGMELDPERLKDVTLKFMSEMNSFGITSSACVSCYTIPAGNQNHYAVWDEMNREMDGGLPVRMFLYPCMGITGDFTEQKALREKYHSPKVKVAGLKEFLDGVVVGGTAYSLTPYKYNGDPNHVTHSFYDPSIYKSVVTKANQEGFSVRMHAISDGSARLGLDVFEAAQKAAGNRKDITNTLEHLDNLEPEDVPRFGELGVIPSMQPAHMSLTNTYFIDSLGERRAKLAYQHRNLIDSGAIMAFGTDVPCAPLNPFETIWYALTRCDFDGNPLTQNPDQAVTLGEALKAYTDGSSHAVNAYNELGTLTAGKYADIAVIDGPMFGETPEAIRGRKAQMTISAGKIVYKR